MNRIRKIFLKIMNGKNLLFMEIVLERIAKKNTYTIGRLYLLADGDVKRKVLSGKTAGDKRSFEHTFDLKKLSKDSYFCDTLEPTWRNLNGIALKPGEVNAKYSRQSGKVARKIPGHTAIPRDRIVYSLPSRPVSRSGCRMCREFPVSRASVSMPATIPTIPRAASWWARTR